MGYQIQDLRIWEHTGNLVRLDKEGNTPRHGMERDAVRETPFSRIPKPTQKQSYDNTPPNQTKVIRRRIRKKEKGKTMLQMRKRWTYVQQMFCQKQINKR